MSNDIYKFDIKSDYIDAYVHFMSSSLAASSIRLLKNDLMKFYVWFTANSKEHGNNSWSHFAENYRLSLLGIESEVVAKRKMSSVYRFISWIDAEHDETKFQSQSVLKSASNVPNVKRLSLKYIVLLLFIILGLLSIWLYSSNEKMKSNSDVSIDGLKRFVLYVPVISNILPASLEGVEYKLKIYSSDISSMPIITLLCLAKPVAFNSKTYIYIDSSLECKQLSSTLDSFPTTISEYFVDIIVRTSKINNKRIVINANQDVIGNNGNTQSHENLNIIVSKQADALTNVQPDASFKIATSDSSIDTRPSDGMYIPLSVFEIFDAIDGDVVTTSSSNLSKAILNSPVVGVIDGDRLIMSGKTMVNVYGESADISAGDYVSVSLEPGKVVRASLGYENVVGVALESWPNEKNKINTLLLSK